MKVYSDIKQFKGVKFPVVTSGTFDGVHVGHQRIIQRLTEVAKHSGGETVLLTFYPHPRMVLFPDDNELKLLNTQEEKIRLLEKQGIDHLIIYPFTKKFSRLSSVNFIRDILVNSIGTKKLVIGYNHHFGRNREGSFEHMKEYGPVYGFDVEEIPAQDIDNVEISSTKIRKALQAGDVRTANAFLGYSYTLTGKVIKGRQLGRTLGYPTANLSVSDKYKLIPANGIYVVEVNYGNKTYKGMMSIGLNPTVNSGKDRSIEVNILDFEKDIYGDDLTISFIDKIRDEEKFESLEKLKLQLGKDKQQTLKTFEKLNS
ncbi:MAG: bifunctional riboflavin kinase/FAD synthetase [Bacteroidetes bacterium]|nr:bifunctional riboflavin kinase/FAD synthetase [Bacteroidota bacterium]